jgi:hypothetical protein
MSLGAPAPAWVVVQCHAFTVAIPSSAVRRVVLEDEAQRDGEQVRIGSGSYRAFDLGVCLRQPEVSGAWVLLEVGHGLTIGLRTGRCLEVLRTALNGVPLPGQLFSSRPKALRSVFELAGTTGYELAVEHLLTPPERTAAAEKR